MSFHLESTHELAQRRVQRLNQRCQRAQRALDDALAYYRALLALRDAGALQLQEALRQMQQARHELAELQFERDLAAAEADRRHEKPASGQRDLLLS